MVPEAATFAEVAVLAVPKPLPVYPLTGVMVGALIVQVAHVDHIVHPSVVFEILDTLPLLKFQVNLLELSA